MNKETLPADPVEENSNTHITDMLPITEEPDETSELTLNKDLDQDLTPNNVP